MIHQLRDAEKLLGEARSAGVGVRRDDRAGGIAQAQRFAARGELAGVIADDEQTLAGARPGRARAERGDARRDVDAAVRPDHRARREGEVHPAVQPPAGEVHRDRIRITQLDVFLRLVGGRWIELDGAKGERRAAQLRVRNADGLRIDANAVHVMRPEEMRAAGREVVALENRDGGGERMVRAVARAPAVAVEYGVVREQRIQLIEARLIAQLIRRRAGRLEQFVHQRAQAAQEQFARGGCRVNSVEEVVRPAAVAPDHAIERMADVGFATRAGAGVLDRSHVVIDEADLAEAEILVPREELPQPGTGGVAIDVDVLDHAIPVLGDHAGGEVIDHFRQVEQIEERGAAIRVRRAHTGDERLKVGVVFVLAGLLLNAGCGGIEQVENLVERADGIKAAPFEEVLAHLLGEDRDIEEGIVLLHADVEGVGRGHAGVAVSLEGERPVDVGLVLVGRVEIQLLDARLAGRETEMVAGMKIELVGLLRERRRARSAHAAEDVVVKFAVPINRAARACGGVRGGHVLHKPVEDRERVGEAGIRDDGAEVGGGFVRVLISRIARDIRAGRVRGGDIPAHHLTRRAGAGGNARAINAVARSAIATRAVVEERHADFAAEHDAVTQRRAGHRREGRTEPRRDGEVVRVRHLGGRVPLVSDDGAERIDAGVVGAAGRGHGKVTHERRAVGCEAVELREQQQVGAVGRIVQRVEGEDVRARDEEAAELRDIEVEEVRRSGIGARSERGGVEGGIRGRVAARDLLAVEIGDEAVLKLHPQRQPANVAGIGHRERHAGIKRGAVRIHHRLDVQADERKEVHPDGLSVIAKAGGAVGPGRVVEFHGSPGEAEIVVRRQKRANRRAGTEQRDGVSVSDDTVRNVGHLRREQRCELRDDVGAVRGDECEILAARTEFEIGVQRRAGRAAIFLRGEDDKETIGRQVGGRELPLGEIVRRVGEKPTREAGGGSILVLNFNPVGVVAVLVIERDVIDRHELGDGELGQGGKGQGQSSENQGSSQPEAPKWTGERDDGEAFRIEFNSAGHRRLVHENVFRTWSIGPRVTPATGGRRRAGSSPALQVTRSQLTA